MKKLAMLIFAMAALSMLVASVSIAEVPPPPVNQTIGFDDKNYEDYTVEECLECHQYFGSNPDTHHLLYGTDMPDGFCAANTGTCVGGGSGACAVGGAACTADGDCPEETIEEGVCTPFSANWGSCQDGTTLCPVVAGVGDDDSCDVTGPTTCVIGGGTCDEDGSACAVDGDCPLVVVEAGVCTSWSANWGTCQDGTTACPAVAGVGDDAACDVYGPSNCTLGGSGAECGSDLDCAGGTCDVTVRDCYTDADCVVGIKICSNSGESCDVAEDCPRQYQHPTCDTTPYCNGTSAAANIPGSDDNDGVYGCLTCHEEDTSGGTTNFIVERDCMVCHVQLPNSPDVHHLDEPQEKAKAGSCVECHGNVVDDMGDGHIIPTYVPSLVTPGSVTTERICTETGWGPAVPCSDDADCSGVSGTSICDPNLHKSEGPAQPGSCDYCHEAGADFSQGAQIDVINNHDTHHGTGVYKDRYGNTATLIDQTYGETACTWCHYLGNPHNEGALDPIEIRTCEGCHGMESLHSIQADSNGGGIVVGGELYGYGHVGIDDPSNPATNSDCFGCHGFAAASVDAPGSEVIAPTISGSDTNNVITADTDTQLVINGNALTGTVIELTPAAGGDVIVIDPVMAWNTMAIISINVPTGAYDMRANNSGERSNVVALNAIPETEIIATIETISCSSCVDGDVTITGTGFGPAPVAAADEVAINVEQDGVRLAIISWSDTQIVANGYNCDGGAITVNGLFGSATK